MILKGTVVKIKPEWQDPGDDTYTWTAIEDERPATPGFNNARIRIQATKPGSFASVMEVLTFQLEPPTQLK